MQAFRHGQRTPRSTHMHLWLSVLIALIMCMHPHGNGGIMQVTINAHNFISGSVIMAAFICTSMDIMVSCRSLVTGRPSCSLMPSFQSGGRGSLGGCRVQGSCFLVATQIKKNDDGSYSKVSHEEHVPPLVRIPPPNKKLWFRLGIRCVQCRHFLLWGQMSNRFSRDLRVTLQRCLIVASALIFGDVP
jgi:hypothetical protein